MKLDLLGNVNGVDIIGLSLKTGYVGTTFDDFSLHDSSPDIFSSDNVGLLYRSVSYDKWDYIKENGIDVYPTNSAIFCDYLEKASEYGGWPKVIMGYDIKGLDRTYREVDSCIDKNELEVLLKTFPFMETSKNGKKLWLSRLSLEDKRRNSSYEISYANWIPGNPWDSLKIIILADLNGRSWAV